MRTATIRTMLASVGILKQLRKMFSDELATDILCAAHEIILLQDPTGRTGLPETRLRKIVLDALDSLGPKPQSMFAIRLTIASRLPCNSAASMPDHASVRIQLNSLVSEGLATKTSDEDGRPMFSLIPLPRRVQGEGTQANRQRSARDADHDAKPRGRVPRRVAGR